MSNRRNQNDPRPPRSMLSLTPDEIEARLEKVLESERRYYSEIDRLEKEQDRKRAQRNQSSTQSSNVNNLKGARPSDIASRMASGAMDSMVSAGFEGGAKGLLSAGISGAKSGLSHFTKGLSASTIGLTLLTEAAKASAKALMKYAKDTNEHSNKLIRDYSVSRQVSNRFLSDSLADRKRANQYLGGQLVSDGDVRSLSESLLPRMRDISQKDLQSMASTGLIGQELGVSYNEQTVRMMRQQYKMSQVMGDGQLERLDNLAALSQVGNMSLDELVQLQSDDQSEGNKMMYRIYNSMRDTYGEDGAKRIGQGMVDTNSTLSAMLTSVLDLDANSARVITNEFNSILGMSTDEVGQWAGKFATMTPDMAVGMQQRLLKAYASGDRDSVMSEFKDFSRFAMAATKDVAGMDGSASIETLLQIAGLGNPRLTDAFTSGTFLTNDDFNSRFDEFLAKYDAEAEKDTIQDLAKGFWVDPKTSIMGAINDSEIGIWAKMQASTLLYKAGRSVGDLFTGSNIDYTMNVNNPNTQQFRNTPQIGIWNGIKSLFGMGGPDANLGMGGGYGKSSTPSTAPPGVGAFTMTAGFQDPLYTKRFGKVHKGVDYGAPAGTPILSTTEGIVEGITVNNGKTGYGNLVMVRDSQGNLHRYAHMLRDSFKVKKGQRVVPGQILGGVGTTGNSTGNHLHYQVNDSSGTAVNPRSWIPGLFGQAINVPMTQSPSSILGTEGNLEDIEKSLVYRSSLAGLVRFDSGMHNEYLKANSMGVGGAVADAIAQSNSNQNSDVIDALGMIAGILNNISGTVGYNVSYSPKLGGGR